MDGEIKPIRSGALRYQDDAGHWHTANPGDALFSTVTMVATQWMAADGWRVIETGEPIGEKNG